MKGSRLQAQGSTGKNEVPRLRAADLRALRDKYERMLQLRLLHERARAEPDFVEPDPRRALAELARVFPGALREIDELPLEVIRARIDALGAAEADESRVTSWMTVIARFHALARGALAVKRWLAGRALTPELATQLDAAIPKMPVREALEWRDDLAAVAKPPRGRVMDLVYMRLARELGIEVSEARARVLLPREMKPRRSSGG